MKKVVKRVRMLKRKYIFILVLFSIIIISGGYLVLKKPNWTRIIELDDRKIMIYGSHPQEEEIEKWLSEIPFDYILYTNGKNVRKPLVWIYGNSVEKGLEWNNEVAYVERPPYKLILAVNPTFSYISNDEIPGNLAHEYAHHFTISDYRKHLSDNVKPYGVPMNDQNRELIIWIIKDYYANLWAYERYPEYLELGWSFLYGNGSSPSRWANADAPQEKSNAIKEYFVHESVTGKTLEDRYPDNQLSESFFSSLKEIRKLNLNCTTQDVVIAYSWLNFPEQHEVILKDLQERGK